MNGYILTNVRPWGGPAVDIRIESATIESVTSHDPSRVCAGRDLDGAGLLAIPGLINAHAHIDKSWWGQPWHSYGGEAGTLGRINHERSTRSTIGIPSAQSSRAVLGEFLRHGTTAIRTHVDVDGDLGLRGLDVVREAIEHFDGLIDVEIVAFPQDGVLRRDGVLDLLEAAAVAGVHHIGGLDPATIDRDPVGQLDAIFGIAERRGVGIDLHLHDGGELGAFQIELIIDRVVRSGLSGKVNIAHGFSLGQVDAQRQTDLVLAMVDAGVSMTTVAPLGVAPLPISMMRAHGLLLGLGSDGIRDLWSPHGDGDMLKVASTLSRLTGLNHDAELESIMRLVTTDSAALAGRTGHGLEVGCRADIVLIDAENTQDALVRSPRREVVIAGGHVVVRDGCLSPDLDAQIMPSRKSIVAPVGV